LGDAPCHPKLVLSELLRKEKFMKKVLVVDDAPVDAQNLQRIFSDAGWVVISASSGAEAVTKAKAEVPDLIMMDVNMPGLDGFSATRQLMQDPTTKGIPVVFVTSKDQKADRVFAQMLGAKGYVTKPYTPDQILSSI
jgi:twitching motility two-component system response regulator PilH